MMTPNPLARFFLVFLRIAIGWHLAYEGLCKLDPSWQTLMRQPADKLDKGYSEPFSAEGYLRQSTGPLRHVFRGMVPDLHGLQKLDAQSLDDEWDKIVERTRLSYSLNDAKVKQIKEAMTRLLEQAKNHLERQKEQISQYREAVERWRAADANDRMGTRLELAEDWKSLEATRRKLTGPIEALETELETTISLSLDEQQRRVGPPRMTLRDFQYLPPLEQANLLTKWGLFICGVLMIVGLFSQLASLGGAALLALFYFSMPPWPGLPPVPGTEGNYCIVNKNLIEMLACLALTFMPTGVWGGLDALLRGLITRPLLGIGAREVLERHLRDHDDD
jgi:uncharacterized membrane protein YphA (DoxX/SURF4 family)